MHSNDTPMARRGVRAILAGTLAAAMLAGTVAPSAAHGLQGSLLYDARQAVERSDANFRHHFYRGQPYGSLGGPGDRGAAAVADEEAAWHDYCASRFKSYDPSTGTYLGYDGVYKPCT